MLLCCRLSLLFVYLLNHVGRSVAVVLECENTRRRLEDLNEPPLNTPYDVCVVADSHVFIAIKPSGGSGGDSFGFNSCFNGDSNFAQFFNLNDGSEEADRVNSLLDGSEQCVLENQAYGDVRDAIQRADEEWPGLYDLALRNCAPRILLVLTLGALSNTSSEEPDYLFNPWSDEFHLHQMSPHFADLRTALISKVMVELEPPPSRKRTLGQLYRWAAVSTVSPRNIQTVRGQGDKTMTSVRRMAIVQRITEPFFIAFFHYGIFSSS